MRGKALCPGRVGALIVAAAVSIPVSGCAVDRGARAEIAEMRRQVDGYRRHASEANEKADELENRVFVLEDKVDTHEVAEDRGTAEPRLPVVKKSAPPVGPGPSAAPAPGSVDRYTDEHGEEVVVIYEGDAARDHKSRPNIRLHEGSRPDSMTPVDEPAARTAPRARRAKTAVASAGGESPGDAHDRLPVTAQVPAPGGARAVPVAPAGAVAPDESDAIGLYKASYQSLIRREHAVAIAGFQKFLARFGEHDYADNAQYWLGEAYYDQRDYTTALAEFRKVVKRYPEGNKAPDALLKIGYCYAKLGETDAARDVLSQVVEIYPKTEAAKLAAKRLEEMRL